MKPFSRMNTLFIVSFFAAVAMLFWGGFKEVETVQIISLVTTLSVTMAGFGLVAFQIGKKSNELRSDFLESSILLLLSTIFGFFYLVYPDKTVLFFNFGEASTLCSSGPSSYSSSSWLTGGSISSNKFFLFCHRGSVAKSG